MNEYGQEKNRVDKDQEIDAADLTAYALGQLDAKEIEELKKSLAEVESVEGHVAEIQQLAGQLEQALQQDSRSPRSPSLPAELEHRVAAGTQIVRRDTDSLNSGPQDWPDNRGRHAWKWVAAVVATVLLVGAGLEISRNVGKLSRPDQVAQMQAASEAVGQGASDEPNPNELIRYDTTSGVDTASEADEALSQEATGTAPQSEPVFFDDSLSVPGGDAGVASGQPSIPTIQESLEASKDLKIAQQSLDIIEVLGREAQLRDSFSVLNHERAARRSALQAGGGNAPSATENSVTVESINFDHASKNAYVVGGSGSVELRALVDSAGPPSVVAPVAQRTQGIENNSPVARPVVVTGRPPPGGKFMFGLGINSDAGVTGRIVVDEKSPQAAPPRGARVPRHIQQSAAETLLLANRTRRPAGGNEEDSLQQFDKSFFYRPQPQGEPVGTEQYESLSENEFKTVRGGDAVSTFSVDVDTASYANTRRFLRSGRLPPRGAVRIEEMVNYFRYDYPSANDEHPFSVDMEVAQCPWNEKHRLLRVALAGRQIDRGNRGPCNLVFLLDVSGSMRDENKLPLVRRAMKMLANELTEDDRVAIVTYAGEAGIKLQPTSGHEKQTIQAAIDSLQAGGSTNGSAGIQLAYDLAAEHFVEEGANRVILATDGDLNVGVTSDEALVELIQHRAADNVFLTVLGFGEGNLKDAKLEKLADHGNGVYRYVDSMREARRSLVQQMSGNLLTIAKDVKLQVDFNVAEVAAYRLIGYENRMLATEDFADDSKDAGEIGAGHQVTALYELVPAAAWATLVASASRYQRVVTPPQTELNEAAASGDLLTLELRYKQPTADASDLMSEFTLRDEDKTFSQASDDFRFAASVAAFGMILRESQYRGSATLARVEEYASGAMGDDVEGDRAEFLDLVRQASQLRR